MYEDIIGKSRGWHKIEYNWRDSALYALAVGETDNLYVYEKGMKSLPSFGVLPYFNALLTTPQEPVPCSGNVLARQLLCQEYGPHFSDGLHMTHELVVERPMDPVKGSMIYNDTITNIWDRGAGKGMMVETRLPVYDESGQLLCTNIAKAGIKCEGGWGGPAPDSGKLSYPDRAPDYEADSYILPFANKLYRLTGDTNYLHIDEEYAANAGLGGKIIMQGLSSFGFACRMLIDAIIPGEPERMRRMSVQMRAPAYPDSPVAVKAWKVGDTKVIFRYIDVNSGKAILDNSVFEWE